MNKKTIQQLASEYWERLYQSKYYYQGIGIALKKNWDNLDKWKKKYFIQTNRLTQIASDLCKYNRKKSNCQQIDSSIGQNSCTWNAPQTCFMEQLRQYPVDFIMQLPPYGKNTLSCEVLVRGKIYSGVRSQDEK
jgi:hypothetical protein